MVEISKVDLAGLEAACLNSGLSELRREDRIHITVSDVDDLILINAFAPLGKLFYNFNPCNALTEYSHNATREWYSDGGVMEKPGTEARRFCKRHKLKLDSYVVSVMLCYLIPGAYIKMYQGTVDRDIDGAMFSLLFDSREIDLVLEYFHGQAKELSDTLFVSINRRRLPTYQELVKSHNELKYYLSEFAEIKASGNLIELPGFFENHHNHPESARNVIVDNFAYFFMQAPSSLARELSEEELAIYEKLQEIRIQCICKYSPLWVVSNCYFQDLIRINQFEFKKSNKSYMGASGRYIPRNTYEYAKAAFEERLKPHWDLVTWTPA